MHKAEWIERFSTWENLFAEIIAKDQSNLLSDENRIDLFTQFQQALINFGEDLEQYAANTDLRVEMVSEEACFVEEQKNSLDLLIKKIEKLCEALFQYAIAADQKDRALALSLLCEHEAQIALSLRFDFLSSFIQVSGQSSLKSILQQASTLEQANRDYCLIHLLRQCSGRKYLPTIPIADTAIIVQGPILYERDFTLEMLYRYRRIYPRTKIVLSTWENEASVSFAWKLKTLNMDLIENKKPDDGGAYNLKYQMLSTCGGLACVKKDPGIKYVLKTRTDQVMFLPDFLSYFKNMLQVFPPAGDKLCTRFVFLGGKNTMLSFPFRVSDFLCFGTIDDVEKFYSVPHDGAILQRTFQHYQKEQGQNVLSRVRFENASEAFMLSKEERINLAVQLSDTRDPESYLTQTFYENYILERNLHHGEDVFAHYWNFVKNYTVMADADLLIFYWRKYLHASVQFDNCDADGGLTHSVWMQMYCGQDY